MDHQHSRSTRQDFQRQQFRFDGEVDRDRVIPRRGSFCQWILWRTKSHEPVTIIFKQHRCHTVRMALRKPRKPLIRPIFQHDAATTVERRDLRPSTQRLRNVSQRTDVMRGTCPVDAMMNSMDAPMALSTMFFLQTRRRTFSPGRTQSHQVLGKLASCVIRATFIECVLQRIPASGSGG